MREIRFRGKRIDNGEWVYGSYIYIDHNLDGENHYIQETKRKWCNTDDYNQGWYHALFEVHPDTVGQFTGLHDKNGKEIYEGDIVLFDSTVENMPNTKHVVKRLPGHFAGGGILGAGDYDGKDVEVIGTIHDKEN